jgi:hypothetical protein
LRERKNRKEGWQFKYTIADGEKTISSRVSSRFETFIGYTLIERTAECKCRGGLAHDHPEVEDIAVPADQAPATKAGAAGAGPEPDLTVTPVKEGMVGFQEFQENLILQSPCRTCKLSALVPSRCCDDIHAAPLDMHTIFTNMKNGLEKGGTPASLLKSSAGTYPVRTFEAKSKWKNFSSHPSFSACRYSP